MGKGVQPVGEAGEGIHDLTRAFDLFSQKISRLEQAYVALKQRFESVNLELEETNRSLSSILGNMQQGLIFIRADGTIRTVNSAAEALLGWDAEAALGCQFDEVESDTLLGFSLEEALQSGSVPQWGRISLDRNGVHHDIEVTATFVQTDTEETEGLLLLLQDVTELGKWKRMADRNDRMAELGEMAASVAHEIRNPLGGIGGFAALLVRDLEDRPDCQRMARYIVEGSEALNKLVTNILHYSRPLKLSLKPIQLTELIDQALLLLKMDSAFPSNIQVNTEFPEDPLLIAVDSDALKGALLNLFINATQAMPDGGHLTVRVLNDEDTMQIEVEDEGVGIPEEQHEKIFSPFYTTKHDGNGFGLSEVYRVIQGHGGTVEVLSEVSRGTCFTLKLPFGGE